MKNRMCFLLIAVLASVAAQATLNDTPAAIAPGAAEGVKVSPSVCPTFHWGGVAGARQMELVVYRLEGFEAAEFHRPSAQPVLQIVLPGSARGWTPSLGECLTAGGRYAWAVRALAQDGTSPWSQPRLFEVAPGPSPSELAAAIEVLRRHLGFDGTPVPDLPSFDPPVGRASRSGLSPGLRPQGDPRVASIPGSSALQAESAATSGENHGVVGVTHSAEGFALAGENAGGGPDLLLRGETGSPDAQLAESFLDRPSDSDQSFDIRNSLTGTMTLEVDGVEVVTTGTDRDTLAGLGCAPTQVAQWNGSMWICASSGTDTLASLGCGTGQITRFGASAWECSTDLDTLGGLSCSQDQVAQWNGAAWVCAAPSDALAGLACAGDQVIHWDGAVWVCGQPTLTYHTCSNSGFPGDCTANCPAGTSVWVGGCTAGSLDYLTINGPTGGASGPSGWRCQSGDLLGSSSSVTAELYCVPD